MHKAISKQIDDSCRVDETYRLDSSRLREIIGKIIDAKTEVYLRDEGIGISGVFNYSNGGKTYGDIGRLVKGSQIKKDPNRLYLQLLAYDGCHPEQAEPNLIDLLREFVI